MNGKTITSGTPGLKPTFFILAPHRDAHDASNNPYITLQ